MPDTSRNRAAQMMAEQARKERVRRLLALGGVGLVVVLIVVGAVVVSIVKKNHDDRKIEQNVAQSTTKSSAASQHEVVMGPDNATHHVVIYEDFLCPFCGALEKGTHEQLAQLASQGKVQVAYRPFNLLGGNDPNSYSVRAAGAFSIVLKDYGQAIAKKYHDILYANQPDESGPFPSNDDLVKWAVQAGAAQSKVKQPIESNAGRSWVAAATKAAFATGLQGTPTILVDGHLLQSGDAQSLLDAVS